MNFAQTGPVNRVADMLSIHAIQEAQAIAANPVGWKHDKAQIALKQHFYRGIVAASYGRMTKEERRSLGYVRHQIRSMDAALRPTWWRKIAYHPASVFVRDILLGRRQEFQQLERGVQQSLQGELRTLNLHTVQKALSDAGFRIPMESTLRKMMEHKMPHFHLRYTDPTRCKNTDFVLHFERLPNSDFCEFRSFEAAAQPQVDINHQQQQHEVPVRHMFEMNTTGQRFSAEEAAVLVNDGYVCRNENGKDQWIGLDRRSVMPSGRLQFTSIQFDLDKALQRLPLTDVKPAQIARVKDALRSGQARTVELSIQGNPQKCKIVPNPENGVIDVFDATGRKMDVKEVSAKGKRASKAAAETLSMVEKPAIINSKKQKMAK